jgi:adhesin transport system outer membrane protein
LALALAGVAVPAVAAGAAADTLRAVVERAVSTNPEVAALRANRLATDEELEAAKGLGRPKVDVFGTTGYVAHDEEALGGSGYEADTYRKSVSGVLSVPLFDGWKTYYEVERQGNRVSSARHRVADTANSVALQAIQAYLEIQRSAAVLDIADENIAAHRAILARVQARAKAGKSARAEVVQAQARLSAAQASRVEAQAANIDAQSLFLSVVGEPPGQLESVGLPGAMLPASVEEAVERALAEAPSLIAVAHDVQAAEAEVGTAQAEFYPKIDVEVAGRIGDDTDHNFTDEEEVTVLLVLKKNLYNGGIDSARVRETRHRVNQSQSIATNAGRLIEKEVRLSWLAMHAAKLRADLLAEEVEQNRILVEAFIGQFDLSERSLMDILDIQNEVFTASSAQATERFARVYNAYRLMAAMGSLLPALEVAMPDEALSEPDLWRSWVP